MPKKLHMSLALLKTDQTGLADQDVGLFPAGICRRPTPSIAVYHKRYFFLCQLPFFVLYYS